MLAYEYFPDIYSFRDALASRKNTEMLGNASNERDFAWYKTNSYAEADELLQCGDRAIADRVIKALNDAAPVMQQPRRTVRNNVYGGAPNVARALQGHPKAMRQVISVPVKAPSVHIVYSCSALAGVQSETMIEAGVCLLRVVKHLEAKNTRVELTACNSSSDARTIQWCCCVGVKKAQQPLDIIKLTYLIAHPSALRRHGFRWRETFPQTAELTSATYVGYGGTDTNILRNAIRQKRPGSVVLDIETIKRYRYDPDAIISDLEKFRV